MDRCGGGCLPFSCPSIDLELALPSDFVGPCTSSIRCDLVREIILAETSCEMRSSLVCVVVETEFRVVMGDGSFSSVVVPPLLVPRLDLLAVLDLECTSGRTVTESLESAVAAVEKFLTAGFCASGCCAGALFEEAAV